MFTQERMREIIKKANDITNLADNGKEVPNGTHIARHELRDLTVLAMYLADYYQITQEKTDDVSSN